MIFVICIDDDIVDDAVRCGMNVSLFRHEVELFAMDLMTDSPDMDWHSNRKGICYGMSNKGCSVYGRGGAGT